MLSKLGSLLVPPVLLSGVRGKVDMFIPGSSSEVRRLVLELREKSDRTRELFLPGEDVFFEFEPCRKKSVRVAPVSWYIGSETLALM